MTASMKVVDTAVSDVVVKFRLRTPSDEKVREISESISQVGLISPIVISPNNILLAGYHRYLAYKQLGLDTIPSIVKDVDDSVSELVEIDENLKRNELNHIETAFHIVKREELLKNLGLLYQRGDNGNTKSDEKLTIADIAEGIGLSKRSYQKRKQIAKLNPEVADLLIETEWADCFEELVKLSTEDDDIQKMVCDLLITGKCKTWKMAFYKAKLHDFKLNREKDMEFNFKDRWGQYAKSIMKFNKVNDDLKKLCDLVNHDENLRHQKGSLRFGETQVKLHQMNPEHARFAIEYYTKENDLILDPFLGRNTTGFTALHLNRRCVGFTIDDNAYELTKDAVEKHMDVSEGDFKVIKGCGCEMKEFEGRERFIDAVFSSPPYYLKAEPYSEDDPRDLCNMGIEEFDNKIDEMFKNLSRVIKKSNYKKKIFYPVMMVIGTARDAANGIHDMQYSFQAIAKKYGFTLWDSMHVELNNPHLVCSIKRNYEFKFTHKSHETQLTWVMF